MNDVSRQQQGGNFLGRLNKNTWNKSVPSIVETAIILIQANDVMERRAFMAQASENLLLSESTLGKIMLIGRNRILTNPANFSRLPPVWAKLTILSHVNEDRLQKMIDEGIVHPQISRLETEELQPMRNSPLRSVQSGSDTPYRHKGPLPKSDPRIQLKLAPEKDLIKICEWGIQLETGGMTLVDAAKKIGLSARTYQWTRDIVTLSKRTDLPPAHAALVNSAMNDFRNGRYPLKHWYRQIRPIVERIWGIKAHHRGSVTTNKSGEQFKRAVLIIQDTCEAAAAIGELHLGGREEYVKALKQVKSAQSDLRTIVKTLINQIDKYQESVNDQID